MRRITFGLSLALAACSLGSDEGPPVAPSPTPDVADVSTSSDGSTGDLETTETDTGTEVDGQTVTPPDTAPDSLPETTPDSVASPDASPEVTSDSLPDSTPSDAATPEDTTDTSEGPWPTNPNKDAIADPGWESVPGVGTTMPNFTAIDQYGSSVELYDLAMDGRPIVLDVGTWFCEPCKSLAWYLATGETGECPYSETILDELGWWNESYEIIKELVDSGQIRWVSILYSLGNPVTPQDAAAWHEAFPHDEVVVLADSTLQLQEYLSVEAMPRIDVLDEEMTFLVYHTGGPNKGLQKIVALFAD